MMRCTYCHYDRPASEFGETSKGKQLKTCNSCLLKQRNRNHEKRRSSQTYTETYTEMYTNKTHPEFAELYSPQNLALQETIRTPTMSVAEQAPHEYLTRPSYHQSLATYIAKKPREWPAQPEDAISFHVFDSTAPPSRRTAASAASWQFNRAKGSAASEIDGKTASGKASEAEEKDASVEDGAAAIVDDSPSFAWPLFDAHEQLLTWDELEVVGAELMVEMCLTNFQIGVGDGLDVTGRCEEGFWA